jgi:hypothetical protein
MACFLVPAAEAVVVKIIEKHEEKKEAAARIECGTAGMSAVQEDNAAIPASRKLRFLFRLLAGGSVLLAFEHLWHGEITLYFPFLTAVNSHAEMVSMLHEMATAGVMMSVSVTAVWAAAVSIAERIIKRGSRGTAEKEA